MHDVLAYLQGRLPHYLFLLEQMVTMESPSFDKPLVDHFTRYVAGLFSELGGQAELVPSEHFGDHLRVVFGSKSPTRLLLLGHTDTVSHETIRQVLKRGSSSRG